MKLIASQLDLLLQRARDLLIQLDLPSKDEYIVAASTATRDLRVACASSWNFTYISFRPIFILLGILGHYLAIVLHVIAKHSVAHGWIAAKEGYYQLRTATIWFVKFQKELPRSAKYAEAGALAAVIALWLLRRHVKKQRYVERIVQWYGGKKRRALRKYQNLVERVAKTSSFLALLLPHLLYAVLVMGTKRIVPSLLTYLATRTYLCSVLSFWHPLYLTCSVLGRLSHHLKDYREAAASEENAESNTSADGSSNATVGSWKARTMTPSRLKQQQQQKIELAGLKTEVVDLLKYWVVYAILLAIVRTGKLLPFVGHVLNATTDNASVTPSKLGKKAGLYSKLRLPGRIVDQITLVFVVWLRLMPAPITANEVKDPKKTSTLISSGQIDVDKHRPVDILYRKLSPIVLSAMNSSAFLTKKALGDSRNEGSTLVSWAIEKLQTILDLFVMVRLLSKKNKEWLVTTIVESSALLPAVTTLLMPSYFTNYGVIYVSLVVPAGYSISSCNAVRKSSSKVETMMPKIDDASRYLQFWVVGAAVSLLLGAFAPLLAWVPLSTHATWLLWAYVQLESVTRKIYGWFENEFGKKSLEDTAVVRLTRRTIAALPSNVADSTKTPDDANSATPAADGEKSKVA